MQHVPVRFVFGTRSKKNLPGGDIIKPKNYEGQPIQYWEKERGSYVIQTLSRRITQGKSKKGKKKKAVSQS